MRLFLIIGMIVGLFGALDHINGQLDKQTDLLQRLVNNAKND